MTSARTRARMVERLQQQGIQDKGVLGAINKIERHLFVDEAFAHRAYEDTALPLGQGQTISQPFIVARMIECLRADNRPLGKTLEIGTGCGYQAAVLAGLTKDVYSIERLAGLMNRAKINLRTIKCFNVRLKHGDGYLGIPEAAPFDSIILAAAAPKVPEALLQQMAVGGRMVMPFGACTESAVQRMLVIERNDTGWTEQLRDPVKFVPMLPGVE
ncbi:MAG: protein-L-isoaspartate(D-aspartate) O-methyltransferase [Fluviibacter sp.]